MFPSTETRKILPTNHLKIPEYVWGTADFMKQEDGSGRTLSLPHFIHSHGNQWGFYGFKNVLYQISRINILEQKPFHQITNELYIAFNQREAENFLKLATLLGIQHILYEDDAINKIAPNIVIDHSENRKFLMSMDGIDVVKKFGKWTLYKIQNTHES